MSIATFAELKTAVESAIARTDVPAFVYTLATAELNSTLRVYEMESTTSITVDAEAENLPSDFLEVRAVYLDRDARIPLDFATEFAKNVDYRSSGAPQTYTITGGSTKQVLFNPVPDGTYTVFMRYVAKLTAFSADADTNNVLTTFPALYLYVSLKHAAIWNQDIDAAGAYGAAYTAELERVMKADQRSRYSGGPLVANAGATP